MVKYIRAGIPSSSIAEIAKPLHLTQMEVADILVIPQRTLARRKREGVFNQEESEKVLRLARVCERARQVFADFEKAAIWLKSPNPGLGGARPISLLDTDVGCEAVMDSLGRISQGVFY